MAIVIDDLIVSMAVAAAGGFGEGLARGMLAGITGGDLATKEDLRRAVKQIEEFVANEFEHFEDHEMVLNVDTAILNMKQYRDSGDPQWLNTISTQELLNRAAVDIRNTITTRGEDYLRMQFVPVIRFIGANIAFWSTALFDLGAQSARPALLNAIKEGLDYLVRSRKQIETMETEAVSPMKTASLQVPNPDHGPRIFVGPPLLIVTRAFYLLTKRGYPQGQRERSSEWSDASEQEASQKFEPERRKDVLRVDRQNQLRETNIYDPLDKLVASLKSLPAD
jgi:hypothetical protein